MSESEILTLEEVARMLRVSERTVTDWAVRGELPGGKLGTSWRFKRSEVERWLNTKLSPRINPGVQESRPLGALLSPNRTVVLDGKGKGDALNQLIDVSVTIPGIKSREELAQAVFAREQLMSTGIGLGIGVPHVRLPEVKDVYLTVGVCRTPLSDYESLDGEPIRILVLVIAGRDQHSQYIKVLARITGLLKDPDVRAAIVQVKNGDELFMRITEGEFRA